MRKILVAATGGLLFPNLAFAQDGGIDQAIGDVIKPIVAPIVDTIFYSVPIAGAQFPLIVGWLILAAIIFTFYFGFIQFRAFKHAIELVRGDYSNPNDAGEVSHFQALATALSGTVGLGNIAGVAVAVSLGGPGATFWMIVAGLFGMCSKFTECTLGVKYRNEYSDGTVSGGPMYYLSKGLAEKGLGGLGRVLAVFFAICCVIGSMGAGNMFQANQSFQMLTNVTGGADSILAGNGWLFGLVIAALVAITIIGGIKSIARVTDKIVPFMAVMYVTAAIVILLMNIPEIPGAIGKIISGAFAPEAVGGGIVGVLIQGLKRATFSNEAGVGSAPIAHSAVRTKEPVTEGIVALLEPFIDTVVICTMTALVIVVTGTYQSQDLGGIDITAAAFESAFSWFPYVLTLAVLLFAFSTMIAWSYYGLKAWTYLFGESKRAEVVYKAIFCAFIVIGASIQLGPVIDFSDAMFFAMSIANIIGLYILMPVVKREVTQYFEKIRSGAIVKYVKP